MAPQDQPPGTPGPWAPPPSTMAAQLINNLSTKRPSRQVEHDELQLLMNEVSTRENDLDGLIDENAILEHKHDLVYVLAKATLEKLEKNNLFVNAPNATDQACEALDVFTSTVKDFPNILDYIVPEGRHLKTRGHEPLWIWLFPRILSFLGRRDCERLTTKIDTFFSTSFEIVAKSPRLWKLGARFFSYLKDIVSSILNNLQHLDIIAHGQTINLVLPSDQFDLSTYCDVKEGLNQPFLSCNYVLHQVPDALNHALNILSTLSNISMQAASFQDTTPDFQNYLAWMLDSFQSSYEFQKVWIPYDDSLPDTTTSAITLFCTIHTLFTSIRTSISESLVRKGYTCLTLVGSGLIAIPSNVIDKGVNLKFCQFLLHLGTICHQYHSICRIVHLDLVPRLRAILDDEEASAIVGDDFQNASTALIWACESALDKKSHLDLPRVSFEIASLNVDFSLLALKGTAQPQNEAPPSKRRRIHTGSILEEVTSKLYKLLNIPENTNLPSSTQSAVEGFAELEDSDRRRAIEYLSMIPCAARGSLVVTRDTAGNIDHSRCFVCEKMPIPKATTLDNSSCQLAFFDSKQSRVLAMIALKGYAIHFTDEQFFNLETSSLGQWCLQSLQSSIRELRIAAGRTLPEFLQGPQIPHALLQTNRNNVLLILRDLCERPALYLQETCVLAWGQLGRILEDSELNLVLLKLVEHLGHSNSIVSNAAYNEILKLANYYGTSVGKLFSAFWGSIAIAAVKHLLVRPQTTQLMADLLEITVPEFLILTQSHTLPWLVLWQESKIIKKIAQARDLESWRVCMDSSNVVHIMALLLVQDVPDIEKHTMSVLKCVSSDFEKRNVDFAYLLKMDPSSTFLHLLKVAGDADESRKLRVRRALQFLVERVQTPENNRKGKSAMAAFLEQHNLGHVMHISEVINETRDEQSTYEKKRNVRAIEEMIIIGTIHTRFARPQICACLQSALAQKELQTSAFSAWSTMLYCLDNQEVEMMLESTFATIIQYWDSFDQPTKIAAEELIQYLLAERARPIRNKIVNLPSLSQFPQLADVERKLNDLRTPTDVSNAFEIFSRRVRHESAGVVAQALSELKAFLHYQQSYLQASAVSEQPDVVVGRLVRSVMDACVKFNESNHEIAELSGECIGLIGCLDPNRVETVREQREMVVVANFEDQNETENFVLFMLDEVIVKAFLSATDTNLQGFFSFVMQQLLDKGGFKEECVPILRGDKNGHDAPLYRKWALLPEGVQTTLTPFLTSKFTVVEKTMKVQPMIYPIFRPGSTAPDRMYRYNNWLKDFVVDLMQRHKNNNAELIFVPLCRAIRIKDLSVASFILPYAILHVVVLGTDQERQDIGAELLSILKYEITAHSRIKHEELRLCSEAVFRVLDYLSRWIQAKQLTINRLQAHDVTRVQEEIQKVSNLLESIPAEIVSGRAIECKSYSRALFYWEQHIRHARAKDMDASRETRDMERLQEIYTQIDEPDGIEGISAHLHVLDIDQIILGHRKAGRWTAAQGWYEIKLAEDPDDVDIQLNLLTCLKESGQHDVLLNYLEGMHTSSTTIAKLLPFATEASWATGRWNALEKYTAIAVSEVGEDFNVSIGKALLALHRKNNAEFTSSICGLREQIARSLSRSTTSSIGSFHDPMLKLHVLTELEMIAGTDQMEPLPRQQLFESLNRRLETIGGYLNDKQYLLGIRRAAMQLSSIDFSKGDLASVWLTSARLARKGNAIHQSFNAVLHASQLGDDSAKIEHARLLWKEEQHRKAIQSLKGAIESNAFISHNQMIQGNSTVADDSYKQQATQQNLLEARAHLLLAKWLDVAGQTNSATLRSQYQQAVKTHGTWEKAHYYLGRHYNNLFQSKKSLAPGNQDEAYLSGELATLIIANYLRSLTYGTKYIYQTLPRILTLWLDLGIQVYNKSIDPKFGNSQEFVDKITKKRRESLSALHQRFTKYIPKMPAYIFYTALPQIVSRITHPHKEVNQFLQMIINKVVTQHPQQSLWSLLAISTSTQQIRRNKGIELLTKLTTPGRTIEQGTLDPRSLIRGGQALTSEILKVCEAGDFPSQKTYRVHLTQDLHFRHKVTPCSLAVPVEAALTATLPTLTDKLASHKAFSRDVITINSFEDEVLVLNSLAKPRKLTALGSNGQLYGLLCKPKDDLRKDQRLMEFNGMINRSLKRDAESSRRQLYIRTYAVTPLNEECGIIEWVDGLKTFRDILLTLYKPRGVRIDYNQIALYCEEATKGESKLPFFTEKVLGSFPPVFHFWFVQQFPEPSAWFAARLRYTRSCAVMSMIGTILGLGDRHTENILFEEGNGGTFHVDFNCLFDKGHTFTKPERVPFRLTHNMIDAMGMYGYEGPFRKSSELTLRLLRQHEETLMTILEAFIYDPTLDLVRKADSKKRRDGGGGGAGVTDAQSVLDTILRKVRGLLQGESVPLSVEGHVDELISQATDPRNLTAMYIGWCAFF